MNKDNLEIKVPSMDEWLKDAKTDPDALEAGMYLVHNGVVRESPRDKVRHGIDDGSKVKGMEFDYDPTKVDDVIEEVYKMEGVFHIRVWLNRGKLKLGDDIMYALVGGDTRTHVIDALEFLLGKIKSECVKEIEIKA